MATTDQHTGTSERLLAQAEATFEAGDLRQASEKAWWAVAGYIGTVAEENGWEHNALSFGYIRQNAKRLFGLTGDRVANLDKFTCVERLYMNYFENDLESQTVSRYIGCARDVLETLKRVAPLSVGD